MHTSTYGKYHIIHNGDYSGECCIVREKDGAEMRLPCQVLLDFAADVIRGNRIEVLEQATTEELLK